MASAEVKDAGEELREQLRDLFKVVRPLRHLVAQGQAVPVSPGMLGVLATIEKISAAQAAHGGCHSKDLAARFAVNPSTISRAVGALVRLGLVCRGTDPTDKRAHFLAVTDAGRAVLAATESWYDDMLRVALDDWGDDDIAAFTAMLRRFTAGLDGYLVRHLTMPPPTSGPPSPPPPSQPEPTKVESYR